MRLLNIKIRNLCNILIVIFLCASVWNFRKTFDSNEKEITIKWWTKGFPGTEMVRRKCGDILCIITNNRSFTHASDLETYIFYGSDFNLSDLPVPRDVNKDIWALFHEESPRNEAIFLEEKALRVFNYSATFSRFSDLPLTLQYFNGLDSLRSNNHFQSTKKKNMILNSLAPILYLQSDCDTSTDRDAYVVELMKFVKVDSYGFCLNNRKLPVEFQEDYLNNMNKDDFLDFVSKYKFTLAFENGVCHDYITEKLWRPLTVGSIPIYYGSPTVRDWIPNEKSIIHVRDFLNPKSLADYVIKLNSNDTEYDNFLEHKLSGKISNKNLLNWFESNKTYNQEDVIEEFECLVCTKTYQIKNDKLAPLSIVDKKSYDCPRPVSALTSKEDFLSGWPQFWDSAKVDADRLIKSLH